MNLSRYCFWLKLLNFSNNFIDWFHVSEVKSNNLRKKSILSVNGNQFLCEDYEINFQNRKYLSLLWRKAMFKCLPSVNFWLKYNILFHRIWYKFSIKSNKRGKLFFERNLNRNENTFYTSFWLIPFSSVKTSPHFSSEKKAKKVLKAFPKGFVRLNIGAKNCDKNNRNKWKFHLSYNYINLKYRYYTE